VAIAVAGVCAETGAEARAIAARPHGAFRTTVVGTAASCADQLAAIADRYRADDVVFVDRCDRFDDRLACYRLLAEALVRRPATDRR
jgi:alkanesulfonate monooxygenase SsuD/methylene tetrahydromethanopterin reductase-like flavin-dependent oxidoreductase (luciferase family)